MSNKIRKLTDDIVDLAELVIKVMVLIAVVYLVAEALIGTVPAQIGAVILGLAIIFIIVTSKKVREAILSFGHK